MVEPEPKLFQDLLLNLFFCNKADDEGVYKENLLVRYNSLIPFGPIFSLRFPSLLYKVCIIWLPGLILCCLGLELKLLQTCVRASWPRWPLEIYMHPFVIVLCGHVYNGFYAPAGFPEPVNGAVYSGVQERIVVAGCAAKIGKGWCVRQFHRIQSRC